MPFAPVATANPFVWSRFLGGFAASPDKVPPLFSQFKDHIQPSTPPEHLLEFEDARPRLSTAAKQSSSARPRSARTTTTADLQSQVTQVIQGVLGAAVGPDEPLIDAGLDSLGAVEVRNALEREVGMQLPSTLVFDYATVGAVTGYLSTLLGASDDAA
eukprot:2497991-Pyramimonas_sp.AAC.1